MVKTDIQIKLPSGYYGRVAPRSGLALKNKLDVGAGVIDEDYRGNVGVILFNFGDADFEINEGDRVAQLICEKIYPEIVELEVIYNSIPLTNHLVEIMGDWTVQDEAVAWASTARGEERVGLIKRLLHICDLDELENVKTVLHHKTRRRARQRDQDAKKSKSDDGVLLATIPQAASSPLWLEFNKVLVLLLPPVVKLISYTLNLLLHLGGKLLMIHPTPHR
ncbi:Deoxyuridine 5'-triphosphate nucleotidohydrolase [Folsomia candida]|uniref:Deoxyuridine 5'-triphosphate nucleotidohydrolase n=1 Tax=Folsomia candida TaxID=158441 RepID=A0A226DK91_FOLCA|nr:Deoxyuridine 5'-triphosphate nucleotidohydrolase [Folsomia candida]